MGDGVDSASKVRTPGERLLVLVVLQVKDFDIALVSFSISGLMGGSEGEPEAVLSEPSETWSSAFVRWRNAVAMSMLEANAAARRPDGRS